jgi:hypothetical protein
MPAEAGLGLVFVAGVIVLLARAGWTYTHQTATADRFGRMAGELWLACGYSIAATITLAVMLSTQLDRSAINTANGIGLGVMLVFTALWALVARLAKRWCVRHRWKSPDYCEDAAGNPLRQADGPPAP